jgi:hypothetical protein
MVHNLGADMMTSPHYFSSERDISVKQNGFSDVNRSFTVLK